MNYQKTVKRYNLVAIASRCDYKLMIQNLLIFILILKESWVKGKFSFTPFSPLIDSGIFTIALFLFNVKKGYVCHLKIKISYILQMPRIKRSRFFELLVKYHKDPDSFSIQYERKKINRKIDPDIEKNIVKALGIEKDLIENKEIPIKYYNYSYIKDLLEQK